MLCVASIKLHPATNTYTSTSCVMYCSAVVAVATLAKLVLLTTQQTKLNEPTLTCSSPVAKWLSALANLAFDGSSQLIP